MVLCLSSPPALREKPHLVPRHVMPHKTQSLRPVHQLTLQTWRCSGNVELSLPLDPLDCIGDLYDSEMNFQYLHLPSKNHLQQHFVVSFFMFLILFGHHSINSGLEGSIATVHHMTRMPLFLSTSYPTFHLIPNPSASQPRATIPLAVHLHRSCPLGHGRI